MVEQWNLLLEVYGCADAPRVMYLRKRLQWVDERGDFSPPVMIALDSVDIGPHIKAVHDQWGAAHEQHLKGLSAAQRGALARTT